MTLVSHWLAAVAVSVVELDAVAFGQFMISRPLVAGTGLGAALGRIDLGFLVGCLTELLGLDELPVGGHLSLNGTVAAGACLLLALGPFQLPPAMAFPAGIFLGWAHGKGEIFLRQGRVKLCRNAQESLEKGNLPRLGEAAVFCMAQQACLTAALLFLFVAAAGPALSSLWTVLPAPLRDGLGFGFVVAPGLAAAGLLASLRMKG